MKTQNKAGPRGLRKGLRVLMLNIFAIALGVVPALALLEFGLRIVNPFETRIRGDEIVLPANKRYELESDIRGIDANILHTKNSIGFRGPEIPTGGLSDQLSIIAIGGSTTECFLLSDGKDWPSVLMSLLEGEFEPIWVNNAGLDGHSTFGHEILLRDIVVDIHPTIAMFLVGANDRGITEVREQVAGTIKGRIRFESIEGLVKSIAAYSEVVSAGLNFSRYLRARLRGLPQQDIDLSQLLHTPDPGAELSPVLQHHAETYIPAYEERLRSLIRIARGAGIDPVFVTQPLLFGEGTDPVTGVNLETVMVDSGESGLSMWRILELYNATTLKIGKQEGVFTIDLANEMQKNSRYFHDGLHYTNRGAEEVARIIHRFLRDYLLQRYSSFARQHEAMAPSI